VHSKDLQPDFVDAIPISVYVSAGKVLIEAPGSVVFKNLASRHLQEWCTFLLGRDYRML